MNTGISPLERFSRRCHQEIQFSVILQFLRFAAVGATGTAVQYAALWVGTDKMQVPAAAASALGFVLGSICNYLLNYSLTFASNRPHVEAAFRYYTVVAVSFAINVGTMGLLVHHWSANKWVAQALATGMGLAWNFAGSRWWAFRTPAALAA